MRRILRTARNLLLGAPYEAPTSHLTQAQRYALAELDYLERLRKRTERDGEVSW